MISGAVLNLRVRFLKQHAVYIVYIQWRRTQTPSGFVVRGCLGSSSATCSILVRLSIFKTLCFRMFRFRSAETWFVVVGHGLKVRPSKHALHGVAGAAWWADVLRAPRGRLGLDVQRSSLRPTVPLAVMKGCCLLLGCRQTVESSAAGRPFLGLVGETRIGLLGPKMCRQGSLRLCFPVSSAYSYLARALFHQGCSRRVAPADLDSPTCLQI